eukprot:TRINITY_DN8_c0_g1_i1.p1 TRINITY_DN8_c0_g1~~TRINITY_DN8_c0_g1_i1.p1  ORF type:complete len:291 (+),score=55.88 TRINITY_DN8_c0_g1_i1:283-1155(+)
MMEVSHYKIDLNNILGKGSSSNVVRGKDSNNDNTVAVKVIDKASMSDRDKFMIQTELRTLRSILPHPNIIKLLDVIETDTTYYIVTEYIDEGDLFEYSCCHADLLTDRTIKKIFLQTVKGVQHLHKYGIVHHDIKLENTGMKKGGIVVVMDLGYACNFTPDMPINRFCGTLAYSAPELLLGQPYFAAPIDVWSLGVLLFVLIAQKLPFDSEDANTLYKQSTSRSYIYSMMQTALVPEDARDLLIRIFNSNPQRRITIPEILKHRYLRGIDFDELGISGAFACFDTHTQSA